MAGIITYEDYGKEDKTKVYSGKILTTYNEEQAKKNYEKTAKATKEFNQFVRKAINDEVKSKMDEAGIKEATRLSFTNNPASTVVRNENGTLTFKSQFDKNKEQMQENNKAYAFRSKVISESPTVQKLNDLAREVNNQRLLAKYNYDVAKEDNHDINLFDRTLGVPLRAVKDFANLEATNLDNYYYDETGKKILPQDYQMRQENVRNSYGDDFFGKAAKFGTDLGYNLTKIGLSSAINTIVPYAGSALYFDDMAQDSFNSAKLDGYDDKSAALFSVVGVASEMLTEKLLGGFSKLSGGESELSSSINKVLGKVMKNDRLRSTLSNAISEGTEEFVQEYIEALNRNLTLGENNKIFTKERFEDALYSTLLGIGSGGLMGSTNVEINTNNTGIIQDVNNNTNQLSDMKYRASEQLVQEIQNKSREANSSKSNVNFIPINEIADYKKNGGYRNEVEIDNLVNNIKTNGIVNPIEVSVNSDGTFNIENGNHRLEVAEKLGLKEIPVVFSQSVVSNPTLVYNNDTKADLDYIRGGENGNFKNIKNVEKNNAQSQSIAEYSGNNSIESENTRTTARNDRLFTEVGRYNDGPSSNSAYKQNTTQEGLDDSSFSFNSNMQLKGNDVLRAKQKTENTTKSYTQSDIRNFFQYEDNSNRKIALPDEVGERLATKTTMTPIEVGRMQDIISSSYDTYISGNKMEINSDYDNNLYNIKATKYGDTYVIDDVVKTSKNSLGSIDSNKNGNISNTRSNTLNENTRDNVIKATSENKNITQDTTRNNYQETVENSTNMKESKFYKNATETSKFITEDNRNKLSEIGDLKYYESVSNEQSLNKASKRLKENGTAEAFRWLQQDVKTSDASDVAEGWILLKNYQDAGDFNSMVAVAKKMRQMGTTAGQTVQAYNIMQRLTPEGMVKYAQSELSEAYEFYAKNKSKTWVEKNASKFDLNAQEVGFIVDTMKQVQKMEDGRAKDVKLGEIQKMLTDKLPPEKGSNIKAWMRISMLFNPKTQVRNVMGNTVITPVNMVGDFFASKADQIISKKTGVRTTGTTDIKSYLKGFKKGIYESYDDFKRGINTRNIDANRFELGEGKSFNDNTKLGKALNKIDTLNGFLLDAGDRGFYEASFTNSINNQLALNNTTKVTQSMIDIATSEALQRTWQDNNNYTKFVLSTRNMLNKVNVKGYGLGDVLIPFAKTPANLTKAIVDYSPAGMIKVLVEGKNLKNNISTGTNTAVQQHQFVQDLGKATAGTMLYVAAYALAKAGIATGESDDDKDTRDFMKNTLGVSSYSIKIGNKSFTYDWAQPVAAPLSIMTNIVNSKNNRGQALFEAVTSSLDSAGSILLEQSFVKSINEVLTNNDGIVSGLENAILDLPTRAIPTFMKQIVDMTDGTQRQTYEYQQPLKTEINKIKSKIPGLSQTLSPSVDTMGREIQKYGGKNNIFNVFLNPANVNTSNISEAAREIYRVYKEIGDNSIMPRVAPYYINSKGEKTILNTEQRKDFQKISGNIIENSINELMDNKRYKSMTDEDKSDVIKKIVDYSYNKARKDILGMDMSNEYNKISEWASNGGTVASYYANKKENDYSLQNPAKYSTLKNFNIDYYDYEEYQTKVSEIKKQYSGTNNTNVRKQKVSEYINSLKANKTQKIILYNLLGGYSIKSYKNAFKQTINDLKISAKEKNDIWNTLF